MFPRDNRRERRSDRPRRRPERIKVEGLETRQLMAYSPFGYSLPVLSVTGFAAPAAAWGGTLAVDVTVQNQGASSLVEPLHLSPTTTDPNTGNVSTNPSTADATSTSVEVYASTRPDAHLGAIKIDTISIPSVTQNSLYETISTFTLPARPKGFPSNGGKIYLTLVVDNAQAVLQGSTSQNLYAVPNPVRITNPLPNLQVTALDIPATLQPGDVIAPTIQIENFGAGNPGTQGPVTVELVASLDKNFGPGDSVVGSFVIGSLPGISSVPTQTGLNTDINLIPPTNVFTTTLAPVKLPTSPGFYYLGIVIDPTGSIQMTTPPTPALKDVVPVGPADPFLPPSTLLVNTSGIPPVFPNLPSKIIAPPTTTVVTSPTSPILQFRPFVAASPVSAASLKAKKRR